jgi:serine/threonine-protein kinase
VPTGWVISQVPPRGRREKAGGIVRYVISQGRHPTAVPSLSGMSQEKATAALLGAHLVERISQRYSETVPSGTVVSWRSLAGSHVFYGDAVLVVFSKGPSPQTIPDNLAGGVSTWTQAESALADTHLTPVQNPRYSTTIPAGFVVTTEPPPGTTVPGHSRVLVFVSQGPPYETIPPIIGKSFAAAEQALAALGLKWQPFGPAGASTVLNTVPSVGQSARYGTTVDVYLH